VISNRADELLKRFSPSADNVAAIARIYDQAVLRRQYEGPVPLLRKAIEQTVSIPQRSEYQVWLADLQRLSGVGFGGVGNYTEARTELEKLLPGQPQNLDILNTLALACTGLSDKEAALKYAEEAVRLMPVSKDALAGRAAEMTRAIVYTRLGDRDRATGALERLLQLPGGRPPVTAATLRLNPEFDPLRNDPHFGKLCEDKQP
jgi:tetratricopeptide (TPR) repeat protein